MKTPDFLRELDDELNSLPVEVMPPTEPPTAAEQSIADRTAARLRPQVTTTTPKPAKQKPARSEPTEEMLNADRLWRQLGVLSERTYLCTCIFSLVAGGLGAIAPTGVFPVVYSVMAAIGFIGGAVAFRQTKRLLVLRVTLQLTIAFVLAMPWFFVAAFIF